MHYAGYLRKPCKNMECSKTFWVPNTFHLLQKNCIPKYKYDIMKLKLLVIYLKLTNIKFLLTQSRNGDKSLSSMLSDNLGIQGKQLNEADQYLGMNLRPIIRESKLANIVSSNFSIISRMVQFEVIWRSKIT